ncbi:MAG: cell division protein FtsW [Lachnospiraceae bacterium]|jgi:cell division protein FtsW|nr:cell division protein FtsW [Lachnospiraceae bacterium]
MDHRTQRLKKKKKRLDRPVVFFDFSLLFIILFLLAFGLIMVYSTSAYSAGIKFGQVDYFFRRQLISSGIGVAGMIIASRIDYHIYWKWSGLFYVVAFILCVAVAIPGIGTEINNSRRWLQVGPLSFQPSEVAKLVSLIVVAGVVCNMPKSINRFSNVLRTFFIVFPLFGSVAYTNLSNALIIMAITVCIIFVASRKYAQFFVTAAILAALGIIFVLVESYRASRIDAWLHPETSEKGYQTLQGLYAIGSGGLFGKGLGQSVQKLGYVPEAQNDMIFSIICEELGLFGAICVICLFILMLWRFAVIANNAKDLYGSLLVVGVMGHIAVQVILNIAVVTNSIPNTGISLPFISYGGTSVIFLLAEMGIVLNISRGIRIEEKYEST